MEEKNIIWGVFLQMLSRLQEKLSYNIENLRRLLFFS